MQSLEARTRAAVQYKTRRVGEHVIRVNHASIQHLVRHSRLAERSQRCQILPVLCVDTCLLYTSDAADEEDSVDLGGRRIIKKKKTAESTDTYGDNVEYL
eukprot:TRINITY_DN13798_c0_g1_i2.p1 TRINITY_DN13798_c0_g1~~TRINITY_DN13798_c0_g1_i2.p1  ORF type:complete len:100 (+),score=0.74 TRINITY_DN13798_c0_g1_i2:113-412(+)